MPHTITRYSVKCYLGGQDITGKPETFADSDMVKVFDGDTLIVSLDHTITGCLLIQESVHPVSGVAKAKRFRRVQEALDFIGKEWGTDFKEDGNDDGGIYL